MDTNSRPASTCSKCFTGQALDLDGDLEQLGHDLRELRLRQCGMLQRLGAQLLMQNVGGGMQRQAHAIGQAGYRPNFYGTARDTH